MALVPVVLSLTSCMRVIGPEWDLMVTNTLIHAKPVMACEGGLSASVTVGELVALKATAAANETTQVVVRHEGRIRIGQQAVLEATCTDADGTEVGYAKVVGRIGPLPYTMYGGSTGVTPPPASAGDYFEDCLTPTSSRGAPPCIEERFLTSK